MLARAPRKLAIFSFFTFLFLVTVWHQSPWVTHNVYAKLPLFSSDTKQQPMPNGDARVPTTATQVPSASQGVLNGAGGKKTKKPWEGLKSGSKSYSLGFSQEKAKFIREYMKNMMNWPRPSWNGHWPPFGDYVNTAYDPNRWEEFDMDERAYVSGHHKLNASNAQDPVAYKPFPDYNSLAWKKQWKGEYVACEGPRGMNLNVSTDDEVRAYKGLPVGFPKAFAGGYDVVGLDEDVCFDRYSRYGPYGFGDDEYPEEVKNWKAPELVPQWNKVNWGELQNKCLMRNQERFRPGARSPTLKIPSTTLPSPEIASSAFSTPTDTARGNMENRDTDQPKYHQRTAVLIRAWTGYQYEENDITAIRAMISELSLQSGGEYQVFLYVHVKDRSLDIFNNRALYQQVLQQNVPEELRDIAILWSESIFPSWYPLVGDWQVYWQQFMCLQYFSLKHPEFDYIWNWETDARYTGHHYHFFEKISEFADKQPRKLLWERNKRYYMPSVHGNYQDFVESTHKDILNASAHSLIPAPVWGPRPYAKAQPPQKPLGPTPPTSFEEDDFQWGVNEPADFITLLPIWDPRNTSWSYRDKIWNYIPDVRPIFTPQDGQADWFTHPDFVEIDRRVFINTVVRLSKRMLQAMHEENLVGRSMQAEMWAGTVALQHGLKAVYAPHPIFNDRHWPASYAEGIFDASSTVSPADGGAVETVQGAWTEQKDSPYNNDREYNFQGWSWYYASKFPRNLYRRWLNWPIVSQPWGEDEKVVGGPGADGKEEERRMCMPGMLLHPVKRMERLKLKP